MPRKPTGTVQYVPPKDGKPGRWRGRVTCTDGTRPWIDPLGDWPNSKQGRARAVETIAHWAEELRAQGLGAVPLRGRKAKAFRAAAKGDREGWWKTYFEHRERLGIDSTKGVYETHILPVISTAWEGVTTEDCERLRDALDQRARDGKCSQKTVFNAWTVWTTAAKAASGTWKKDKPKALKVRDANPCVGVAPPDLDDDKQLQWLYPDEFLKLMTCSDQAVPLEAKRLYAIAVYLFARAGELKALEWTDVDTDRGIVTIRLSYDQESGEVKQTKTGNRGIRRFAIEPALLPLLRAMREESGGEGAVVDMRLRKFWAADLRKHLTAAGVQREALHTTDATRKRLRFHDLRSTGLTWLAIRGDDPLKIQQRAGHTSFEMTQKYIRTAEAVGEAVGDVFPGLPTALTTPANRLANRPEVVQVLDIVVEAPGIEPGSARRPISFRSRA
jgi:integrase